MTNPASPIFPNGNHVQELYYVTPIEHVGSILQHGILSRTRAEHLNFIQKDYSDQSVQKYRAKKVVTSPQREASQKRALRLHDHVPLFFRAHNAKLFRNKSVSKQLCVLRIDPSILKHPEAVISETNAAKKDAEFYPASTFQFSQESTSILENPLSLVYGDDRETKERRKAVQQAEVNIPKGVHPSMVRGICVASYTAQKNLLAALQNQSPVPVDIHPTLFFQSIIHTKEGCNPLLPIQTQPLGNKQFPAAIIDDLDSDDEEATFARKGENANALSDDEYDNLIPDEELLQLDLSAFLRSGPTTDDSISADDNGLSPVLIDSSRKEVQEQATVHSAPHILKESTNHEPLKRKISEVLPDDASIELFDEDIGSTEYKKSKLLNTPELFSSPSAQVTPKSYIELFSEFIPKPAEEIPASVLSLGPDQEWYWGKKLTPTSSDQSYTPFTPASEQKLN